MSKLKMDLSKLFLSAKRDVELAAPQKELLDAAFDNPDLTNIAITGPLGSGKSSLVRSYENYSRRKFAYVSLAEFDFNNAKKEQPVKNGNATYLLERKVIDQLSAKKEAKSAIKWDKTTYPSSRISKNYRAFSMAIVASVFIVAVLLVVGTQAMAHADALGVSPWKPLAISLAVPVLLVVIIGIWYVKSGCPPIVKGVSTEGVGVELGNNMTGESYFDEHLSFIVELFDSRNEDAFVYEDLERLENGELFTKLRELNAILNKAICSKDKPIRFIYCIGDNVLLGEDRTKFFDLMIPVVPVLDGYNSYGALIDQLGEKADGLDEIFLRNISLYVDDYRLLKAIVTDYLVYSDVLTAGDRENFNANKLLAMIAVKNIAPSVFLDLQRRRGGLYEFLNNPSSIEGGVDQGFMRVDIEQARDWIGKSGSDSDMNDRAARLLVYLIDSKNIDEGFFFYLARSDEKGLTYNDRSWLLNVRNENRLYEYTIDNPEVVCSFLQDYEFEKPSRLNLDLVTWMIESVKPGDARLSNLAKCTLGEAKDFVDLAVARIPRFVYVMSQECRNYLSMIDEPQRHLGSLSVVGGAGIPEELMQINDANDGLLMQAVVASAGMYTSAEIECYRESYPSIVDDVVGALKTFEQKASCLSSASCAALIDKIVEESRYNQSDRNCRIALAIDVQDINEQENICDVLAANKGSSAWENIAKEPDSFVDEYLTSSDKLTCSEASLLDLLNLDLSQQSRLCLIGAYTGEVLSLDSITDDACWDASLEHRVVPCTFDNIMSYLKVFGATPQWIAFVNDTTTIEGPISVASEADKQLIAEHVLKVGDLNTRHYERIIGLLDEHSIADIPNNLESDKVKALFSHNVPKMSGATLSKMRSVFGGGYCLNYIASDLAGYVEAIRGLPVIDDELAAVLELKQSQDPPIRERLVELLRLPICITSKHTDDTVALLISKNRVADSSQVDVLKRYGRNEKLDAQLEIYAANLSIETLEAAGANTNLLAAAIPHCTEQVRKEMVGLAADRHWDELALLLRAFGSAELDAIAQGKRPIFDNLSLETQEIVKVLESAKRVSIGSGGRVVIRKLIRKNKK